MTDVKIVVAGIEMTPEQARKVHAELSKLFAPALPQLAQPVTPRPGLRETDFGRYPDSTYTLRFRSLSDVGVANALKKQGGG